MTYNKNTWQGFMQEDVNKNCHSRMFLSGIFNACRFHKKENTLLNRCVEDPRQNSSGMTPNFITAHGFTLIELLVVVLIIGILAAVAVPQYQKAVIKSRLAQWDVMFNTAQKAGQLYLLESPKTYAYLTGKNRVGTVEMPGNCDIADRYCYTSAGSLYVAVDAPSFTMEIDGKYNADGTSGNTVLENNRVTYTEIYGTTKVFVKVKGKFACQWVAEKHPDIMVLEEDNNCPKSGITLPNPPYIFTE